MPVWPHSVAVAPVDGDAWTSGGPDRRRGLESPRKAGIDEDPTEVASKYVLRTYKIFLRSDRIYTASAQSKVPPGSRGEMRDSPQGVRGS